jgi:uncharacterized protein (TIGR00369 family)
MPALAADEIMELLAQGFPDRNVRGFRILRHDDASLTLRQAIDARHMRPGDSVAGPVIMGLADTATWLLILGSLGPLVQSVTTSLSIHFLRRPRGPALHATATFLRRGKRLAVADVRVHQEEDDGTEGALVAQATVSYALPKV